jgi:integrase
MEAHLRKIGKRYHAEFTYLGKKYTQSLATESKQDADRKLGPIKDILYRLENQLATLPEGADVKAFIVSGGKATTQAKAAPTLSISRLIELFIPTDHGIGKNSLRTKKIHLDHVGRILGAPTSVNSITLPMVQSYADTRKGEKHGTRPIKADTIRKELRTFRQACVWASDHGHADAPKWPLKLIKLPVDESREDFRTIAQIRVILVRGAVSAEREREYWACVYLTWDQVKDVVEYVRVNATEPWVYPMFAFVAFTGCRRAEMLRSLREDWDMERGIVSIRETKRKKKMFTKREIPIHARLLPVMRDWFAEHPSDHHAISRNTKAVDEDRADWHFEHTLAGHPDWCKLPGFHTFRHSLASIMALKGLDQRSINETLGHITEEMATRYRHLPPEVKTHAIHSLD